MKVQQCDACGEPIMRGAYDIWTMPGVGSFRAHRRCRSAFERFKLRLMEAVCGGYYSWVRWFLAGNTATSDEITASIAKDVAQAYRG
jgi:hypothetical protein